MTQNFDHFPEPRAWSASFPATGNDFSKAAAKPAAAVDAEYYAFAALDLGFIGCSELNKLKDHGLNS